jgi:hypothetical protein
MRVPRNVDYYQLWPPVEGNPGELWQLLAIEPSGQMRWVADFKIGPFDEGIDIAVWFARVLARDVEGSHV